MTAKTAPKKKVLELVHKLEDDVSFEEIMYRLHTLRQVEKGLANLEAGRTIDHDDMRKEVDEWLE